MSNLRELTESELDFVVGARGGLGKAAVEFIKFVAYDVAYSGAKAAGGALAFLGFRALSS